MTEPSPQRLTRQQMLILQLLVDGHNIKYIAQLLGLAERTVKHHLYNARRNLGTDSTHRAIALAITARAVRVIEPRIRSGDGSPNQQEET